MPDDLTPLGELVAGKLPNVLGAKPVVRGRKKKPRGVSKREVREIVGTFVERNSLKLEEWLGEIYADQGAAAAFDRVVSLLEFSTPKLQRREVTGADDGPIDLRVTWGGTDKGE